MKISDLMVPDPITVTEHTTIPEALDLMKISSIRHLPVVGPEKELRGLVTLAGLKQGLIPSLVGDLNLSDLMIRSPITVSPEDDIEIAAQLIYKHKISGIPVVKEGRVVGIITESDILRAFIDMMGILTATSRVDVTLNEHATGAFRRALQIIGDHGGDVINVGMSARQTGKRTYYFRLKSCKTSGIRKALEKEGFQVEEAMD